MPKRTSPREIARFLHHLSETGNFALACDRIHRGKAGLYKRRAADPVFAQQCDAAIAVARARLSSPLGGGGPAKLVEGVPGQKTVHRFRHPHPNARLRTRPGDIELSVARQRAPQIRRAAANRLTPAGIEAFLAALAATANVRLAAASVGVAPSSIYARYRRHEAFRDAMDEALAFGCDRLEWALIERAVAGLHNAAADPHALAATPEDAADPADRPPPPEPVIARMTVDDALRLLKRHKCDPRFPRPTRPCPTWAEVAPAVIRKIEAIKRMSED